MNSTLTLPDIAETLAAAAGTDRDTATRFVVQLFAAVETQLAASRKAYVPGIGTFSCSARGLDFTPDTDLATAINAPFPIFSPVELTPEAAAEFESEETPAPKEEPAVTLPPAYIPVPEAAERETVTVAEVEPEPEPESEPGPEAEEESPKQPEVEEQPETREYEPAATAQNEPQIIYVARRNPWPWVVALIALVAGFAGGYCLGHYSSGVNAAVPGLVEANEIPAPAVTDTVAAAADTAAAIVEEDSATVAPAPAVKTEAALREPVYDTVGSSRYLTTIARDHYGRKDYWVFIYEANASRLK
ncbi:MAG: hypothetical protein K2L99_06440, partial [Muribaculaceae bacterium]|nr:hypothetical protein [Muribaculaceae bacterium]